MEGTRSALIIASDDYQDPGLRRLRAPASDAQALAAVLEDPKIGGFQVRTLLNQPAHEVNEVVEEFFADRRPDDLLLLHISCHGVKDEDGQLYFASVNTKLRRLGATAVAAEFVNRRMNRSRSRRVLLLLDCCYAGAFERGMTARAGTGIGIEEQFSGRGRAVITASSAMEYAFEGDELADSRDLAPSVFTSALVEGLETGEADRDQDGLVGLDEMYDYVYDRVRATTPNQTPGKWTFGVQGELVIARRSRPITTPAPLPAELQEAIGSPLAGVRAGAVHELERLLQTRHAGLALAARLTLEQLTEDDSRTVAAAATSALGAGAQPLLQRVPSQRELPTLALSTTVLEFGRVAQHSQPPERRVRLGNAVGVINARTATEAGWLKLRQVGDELMVAVDTTAVGEHHGLVTIDSDGGSATIRVQATVDPAPPAVPEVATTLPDEAPAALQHARSDSQPEADLPGVSPISMIPAGEAPIPSQARESAELTGKRSADRVLRWPALIALLGILLLLIAIAIESDGRYPVDFMVAHVRYPISFRGMLGISPFIVVLVAAVGLLSSSGWKREAAGVMVGSASWAALGAGNFGTHLDSVYLEAADILRFGSFVCLLLSSAGIVLLLLIRLNVRFRFTPLHGLLASIATVIGTASAAFVAFQSPSTSYGAVLLGIASATILLGAGMCHPHYIGVATMAGWCIQAFLIMILSLIGSTTIWVSSYRWTLGSAQLFILLLGIVVVAGSAIVLMRAAKDERFDSG
jgi:Caspase domain